MSDRIGAYRQIIPVTSKANVPADTAPIEPPVEGELKWSRTSTFKYSTLEIDPVPAGGRAGVTVRHPEKEEFETRIETLPEPVMWITDQFLRILDNTGAGGGIGTTPIEFTTEAWYLLLTETQREIVGYTATRGGGLMERFKSREVEYYLHLTFEQGSIPRRQGIFTKYGELPPIE